MPIPRHCRALLALAFLALLPSAAMALPPPAAVDGDPVRFASTSPFGLRDAMNGEGEPVQATGRLFLPDRPIAEPVPAVVLLHGSGGILGPRETTYARQFAAMGWATLVIDVFGSRVEPGTRFTERLLNVTEAMFLADAYAGLRFLAEHPAVDGERVALVGFSYGGMAATYAVQEQVAAAYAPDGLRFRAHAAYYAPCIARFDDVTTTGAPYAMLYGTADQIVDPARCAEVLEDVSAGGSPVLLEVFEGAAHQWDARVRGAAWRAPRGLAECSFRVARDGRVRDNRTFLPLDGYLGRSAALAWCADDEGYLIQGDPETRARSDRILAAFLTEAMGGPSPRVDG